MKRNSRYASYSPENHNYDESLRITSRTEEETAWNDQSTTSSRPNFDDLRFSTTQNRHIFEDRYNYGYDRENFHNGPSIERQVPYEGSRRSLKDFSPNRRPSRESVSPERIIRYERDSVTRQNAFERLGPRISYDNYEASEDYALDEADLPRDYEVSRSSRYDREREQSYVQRRDIRSVSKSPSNFRKIYSSDPRDGNIPLSPGRDFPINRIFSPDRLNAEDMNFEREYSHRYHDRISDRTTSTSYSNDRNRWSSPNEISNEKSAYQERYSNYEDLDSTFERARSSPDKSMYSHSTGERSTRRSLRSPSRSMRSLPRSMRSPSRSMRSPSRSIRSHSRSMRSPIRGMMSPYRSMMSPYRSMKSPSRSMKSPSRSTRSPSRSMRSPSRSIRSSFRAMRSPSRSIRSPSRSMRSPSRNTRSPTWSMRSPIRSLRSPSRSMKSPKRDVRSPSRGMRPPTRDLRSPSRGISSHIRDDRPPPRGKSPSRPVEKTAKSKRLPSRVKKSPKRGLTSHNQDRKESPSNSHSEILFGKRNTPTETLRSWEQESGQTSPGNHKKLYSEGILTTRKPNRMSPRKLSKKSSVEKSDLQDLRSKEHCKNSKKDDGLKKKYSLFSGQRKLDEDTDGRKTDESKAFKKRDLNSESRTTEDEIPKKKIRLEKEGEDVKKLSKELEVTKKRLRKTEQLLCREVMYHERKQNVGIDREGKKIKHSRKKERHLPLRLYESDCFVAHIQEITGCGIVEIVGGDDTHVYAFFHKHDLITSLGSKDKLAKQLPIGLRLKANAWYIENDTKIPYIVSNLWSPDVVLPQSLLSKIVTEPSKEIRQMFTSLSQDLAWKLPDNRIKPRSQEEIIEYETIVKENTSLNSSEVKENTSLNSSEASLLKCKQVKENDEEGDVNSLECNVKKVLGLNESLQSKEQDNHFPKFGFSHRQGLEIENQNNIEKSNMAPVSNLSLGGEEKSFVYLSNSSEFDLFSVGEIIHSNKEGGIKNSCGDGQSMPIHGNEISKFHVMDDSIKADERREKPEMVSALEKLHQVEKMQTSTSVDKGVLMSERERQKSISTANNLIDHNKSIASNQDHQSNIRKCILIESASNPIDKLMSSNDFEDPSIDSKIINKPNFLGNTSTDQDDNLTSSRIDDAHFQQHSNYPGQDHFSQKNEMEENTLNLVSSVSMLKEDNHNNHKELAVQSLVFGKPAEDQKVLQILSSNVKSYSQRCGISDLAGNTSLIFHVNQVWILSPSYKFCPFKELYMENDLEMIIPIGTKVNCHALKVSDVYYQAVVLWIEDEKGMMPPKPPNLKVLECELKNQFNEFLLSSKLTYYKGFSFPRSTMRGKIQDYITYELGIITVYDSENDSEFCALFHLDEVWKSTGYGSFILLKDLKVKSPLYVTFPIGTEVTFVARELPCEETQLKYQALAIWSQKEDSTSHKSPGSIIPEFLKFMTDEKQIALLENLDDAHEKFKSHAKLYENNLIFIPVILNGLPENWIAEVSHTFVKKFSQIGVIRITHRENTDMSSSLKLNIKEMHAIFNFSDVYKENGEQCEGKDKILIRPGVKVNLIARSVIEEQTAISIFKKLAMIGPMESKPYITMQAFYVSLNVASFPDCVPKSVILKKKRYSFNTLQKGSAYYLNFNLADDLKAKLYHGESILKEKGSQEVRMPCLGDFAKKQSVHHSLDPSARNILYRSLDKNDSRKLVFGSFIPVHEFGTFNLPATIENVPCKIVHILENYLHSPNEGIVEVDLKHMNVYAYFHRNCIEWQNISQYSPFRLEKILPVFKGKTFQFSGVLIRSTSCVQYVCTTLSTGNQNNKFTKPLDPSYLSAYEVAIKNLCPRDDEYDNQKVYDDFNESPMFGKPVPPNTSNSDKEEYVTFGKELTAQTYNMHSNSDVTFLEKISNTQNFVTYSVPDNIKSNRHEMDFSSRIETVKILDGFVEGRDVSSINESLAPQKIHSQEVLNIAMLPNSRTLISYEGNVAHRKADLTLEESKETSHKCQNQQILTNTLFEKVNEKYDPEDALFSDDDDDDSHTDIKVVLEPEIKEELLSILILDVFENKVLSFKNSKKNEYNLRRKKLMWNKNVLKEELRKLRSFSGKYRCKVCEVPLKEEELEMHLRNEKHWKIMHEEFCKEIDKIKPNINVKANEKKKNVMQDIFSSETIIDPSLKLVNQNRGYESQGQSNHELSEQMDKNEDYYSKHNLPAGSGLGTAYVSMEMMASPSFGKLPEIFVSTEIKMAELGEFPGKDNLSQKVSKTLEGNAQTLLYTDFSAQELQVLNLINKAYLACNKDSNSKDSKDLLQNELQDLRIHFHEWQCKDCRFSSKKKEMEIHLRKNEHWTTLINKIFKDSEQIPNTATNSEVIGDVFGRICMILNEEIAIVNAVHNNQPLSIIFDISGIEFTSKRKRKIVRNMKDLLCIGSPVRVNVCKGFTSSNKEWFYVTSGYVGDEADWILPLPKPVTLLSIQFDRERKQDFEKSLLYVNAMEECLLPAVAATLPELLVDVRATIIWSDNIIAVVEVNDLPLKPKCVYLKDFMKRGESFQHEHGDVVRIGAMLMDEKSASQYLCYEVLPMNSSKRISNMRRTDVSNKKVRRYDDLKDCGQVG